MVASPKSKLVKGCYKGVYRRPSEAKAFERSTLLWKLAWKDHGEFRFLWNLWFQNLFPIDQLVSEPTEFSSELCFSKGFTGIRFARP